MEIWMWAVTAAVLAGGCAALYVVYSSRRADMQKYYDAAYKMIKESCLDCAIRSKGRRPAGGIKPMVCLKWKDRDKQSFVFDPERGIRIGRDPRKNEICIQEREVSERHCILYLAQGRLAVQDLNSANGTWIRRGLSRHLLEHAEYLYSGDTLMVGTLKIRVVLFSFDMADL